MPGAVTVRVQSLNQTWETLGADRARGVWPENVQPQSDEHGATTCSFDLRRDNRYPWPDLTAYTPIEVEIDGVLVWDGRIKETPTRDGGGEGAVINVQAEGWQYHLDDDLYRRAYVHNDLSQWVDTRTISATELTAFTVGATVTTGGGTAQMGWPQGTVLGTNFHTGITLDLGEGNLAETVSYDLDRINGGASVTLVFRGHSLPSANPPAGQYEDIFVSNMGAMASPGTTQTYTSSYAGRWRWLTLIIYAGPLTTSNDVTLICRGARVFADSNHMGVGQSLLKAPVVIADALTRATVLLTGARSIDAGNTITFNIPALAPANPQTPREMIDGVNAYHNYLWRVNSGRAFTYTPQPASPLVEVGEWSSMEFQDATANSGENIYNRVLASASASDGTSLLKSRTRAAGSDLLDTVFVTIPNPTAQTDASGWSAVAVTLTRDTTNFHSAPAGFAMASTLARPEVVTTLTGPFTAGTPYVLQLAIRCAAQPVTATLGFGVFAGTQDYTSYEFPLTTSYQIIRLLWSPSQTFFNAEIHIGSPKIGGLNAIYFDSLSIGTVRPTLVDRRGFRRTYQLQIAGSMPPDGVAMGQIADVWLAAHRTTPFRGSLTVTGDRSVREVANGRLVPAAQLLGLTGQRIRLADRIDPDTGAFGRDGTIAAVSYDPQSNAAAMTLDDSRDNLAALLARLAVIQGGSA